MSQKSVMLAATKSGSGKTTITCALLYALKEKGINVSSFKCGPDYIDPMFHKSVLGIASKNLDLFFTDEDKTRELFETGNNSEISVIEGVMGLYDGLGGIKEEASSYHLAKTLNSPIILIIDAHGMGRSILAEISGFLAMDSNKLIKGIILNKISKGLYESIKGEIEDSFGIKVVGYIPKLENAVFDSRHLGLVMPNEIEDINNRLKEASDALLENVDISQVLDIAKTFKCTLTDQTYVSESEKNPYSDIRIAVAMDEAFCFYYEDNLKLLESLGAEIIPFSPLHDAKVPEDIHGIVLGGGYPENYLKELADNTSMLNSIYDVLNNGMPSLAECGGFMYLHEAIADKNSNEYNMVGIIKGLCNFKSRLVRFGYITLSNDDGKEYFPVKGHEFHYYDSDNTGEDLLAQKSTGNRSYRCSHLGDNHLWGFAHLYYQSNPEFAKWFVGECVKYSKRKK